MSAAHRVHSECGTHCYNPNKIAAPGLILLGTSLCIGEPNSISVFYLRYQLFTRKHVFLELMWLSPVAAWINILSMFLIFCIVLWVIDQYQGGLGLPIQENIDLLSEELKLKLLIVSSIVKVVN